MSDLVKTLREVDPRNGILAAAADRIAALEGVLRDSSKYFLRHRAECELAQHIGDQRMEKHYDCTCGLEALQARIAALLGEK